MGGGQPDVQYIAPRWILFGPYKQGGDKNRGAEIIRDTGAVLDECHICGAVAVGYLNPLVWDHLLRDGIVR